MRPGGLLTPGDHDGVQRQLWAARGEKHPPSSQRSIKRCNSVSRKSSDQIRIFWVLVDIVSQESLGFVGTSRPTKAARSLLSSCSLRGSTTQWSGATRSPNSHLLVVNNSKTCLWWIVDSGELPRSQRFWTWNFDPSPFGGDLALCYKLWMNVVCFSLSMNWALEV